MMKRLLLALPLALLGALWFWMLTLPWPVLLRFRTPDSTAFMRMREAEAATAGADFDLAFQPVPLADIAPAMQRAVIVAEDGRFYEHGGIDWHALADEVEWTGDADFDWTSLDDYRALFHAIRYYRRNSEKIRGRSTITQQLAKNLYFSDERSVIRKLEELVVARRLERFLSKDRILELYLNTVELGPAIFGVEAAAQHYFGRSAAGLSRRQAAALAATLPHPLTSNPDRNPGRMAWRRDMILGRLGGSGPVETVPQEPPSVEVEEPPVLGDPVEPGADTAAEPGLRADTATRY
jgi:monofunctional biosynthetic peptidoglycan transglycosylase